MKKKVNKICIVLCDHESSVAFQVKESMWSSQNFMITKLCLFLKSATHYGNKNCNF